MCYMCYMCICTVYHPLSVMLRHSYAFCGGIKELLLPQTLISSLLQYMAAFMEHCSTMPSSQVPPTLSAWRWDWTNLVKTSWELQPFIDYAGNAVLDETRVFSSWYSRELWHRSHSEVHKLGQPQSHSIGWSRHKLCFHIHLDRHLNGSDCQNRFDMHGRKQRETKVS